MKSKTPCNYFSSDVGQKCSDIDKNVSVGLAVDACLSLLELSKHLQDQAYELCRTFTPEQIEEYVRRS